MKAEQITKYQYCEKYANLLIAKKESLDKIFPVQNFGCGTGQPIIEYKLEDIHRNTHALIMMAIKKAQEEVQKLIDEI